MNVKVCNLRSKEFNKDFIDSIINTGFAVVTHHGIDFGLIKDTQKVWKEFFNNKRSYKSLYVNESDPNMGYTGFGGEKAIGASTPDLKEFYHFKPGQILPPEVTSHTEKLFYLLEQDLAGKILKVLDSVVPGANYSKACSGSNNTVFRALYYPALNDIEVNPGAVRGSAHQDINFITLLVAASSPGLQVMDNEGNWHAVPHEENSIVVNIGDMLQLASGRLFKSTTHRVINPDSEGVDRISMPIFIHPHGDTMLTPGFTAQEYLTQRLNAIYTKGYKK